VHYSPTHGLYDEWVYNSADIDASPIIWAHDLGPQANAELLRYYPDRSSWIVDVGQELNGPYPVRPYGVPDSSQATGQP